ncbi:uncharacterized protein [Musca autumnalis]|uniref:uncharacterized protein n=1 Tax=Musca autumnalis TaxID=221902 RepID=UPI003CE9385D
MNAAKIFSHPIIGIFVTIVHLTACSLLIFHLVWCLNQAVDSENDNEKSAIKYPTILLGFVALCLVQIIMCLILIVGILKKNHHLMAPWIATTYISMVAVFFYTMVSISSSFINKQSLKQNIDRIRPGLIDFTIHICLFYPIYILYKSILVFRLKKEGLYQGSTPSIAHGDSELVDANEIY